MKPVFSLLLLLSLLLSLAACGDASAPTPPQTAPEQAAQTAPAPEETPLSSTPGIDIDLTALSRTMVYSEVYNMVTAPENYIGKTVRMQGQFAVYEGDSRNYFACLIADATACCSQGIEFVTKDSRTYPADYPELGTEITVEGVFETYQEGENTYCQLVDATMTD